MLGETSTNGSPGVPLHPPSDPSVLAMSTDGGEMTVPRLERGELVSIIDAVSEAIAVVDESGVILLVNRAWREFSTANGAQPGQPASCTGVGTNYLQVCEAAAACRSEGSRAALDGIKAVLAGTLAQFALEYACHSPDQRRWFSMRVTPLASVRRGAVITHVNVTDNRLAAQAARDAERQFGSMISAVPGVIFQFRQAPDGAWRFLHVSAGVTELFELAPAAARADHVALTDCILAEDRESHRATLEASAHSLTPWVHEFRIRTRSGRLKWVRGQATPRRLEDGSVLWNGILVDITARKQTEADLVESEQRWKFALEGAGDGVWDWNLQTGQALYSRRWKQMFGYADTEIGQLATEWSSRVHPDDMPGIMRLLDAHLTGRTPTVEVEFRMQCRDGQWCWTLGRGMLVSRDGLGRPLRLVGTNTDITERKRLEAELHRLAFHDALTQLPNRRLLLDRLTQALVASQRTGRRGALLFLDLDNFKRLNDTAGHALGDQLLIEVGRRLTHSVREMDTVARLGGDEFVVLIGDLDMDKADAANHAMGIARKISQTLSAPYRLGEPGESGSQAMLLHTCTASIGLALFDTATGGVDALLSNADRAMYQAKADGPNSIRLVDDAASAG